MPTHTLLKVGGVPCAPPLPTPLNCRPTRTSACTTDLDVPEKLSSWPSNESHGGEPEVRLPFIKFARHYERPDKMGSCRGPQRRNGRMEELLSIGARGRLLQVFMDGRQAGRGQFPHASDQIHERCGCFGVDVRICLSA